MSEGEKQATISDNDNQIDYGSETDREQQQPQRQSGEATGKRTMQRTRQNLPQYNNNGPQQQLVPAQDTRATGSMGGRTGAIRESRIKDRPVPQETRDSSLKIKIELDLEVEVDLYARVQGDVTIGLM